MPRLSSLMEPSAQAAIAPRDAFGPEQFGAYSFADVDRWIVKPRRGARLRPTVDLFTVPYSPVLLGPRRGEWLPDVGESVHRMVRCETTASLLERVRIDGILADRLALKLGWLTQRALAPTQGRVS